MTAAPLVEMRGVTKTFGGVVACQDVDFTLVPGEVHALLGENGAGKSTLMNVLSGAFADYRGEILLGGQTRRLDSPATARAAGISIIHQELDLVPDLSVAENLVLGEEPRTWWRAFDRRRAESVATRALRQLGVAVNPRRRLGDLRVGEQQLVAIAKALSGRSRVLIMDEPTSALGQEEAEHLFSVINALRREGVGVIYISHRLEEVLSLVDRVTVLRDARIVGTVRPEQSSAADIIRMMVGQAAEKGSGAAAREASGRDGSALLELKDMSVRPRQPKPGRTEPKGISLTVAPGEIVGLAGLMGAGRTELLETVFGAGSAGRVTGEMRWRGEPARFRSPRDAVGKGVCFVPEDRKAAGLFFEQSVARNLTVSALAAISRAGFVRSTGERSMAGDQIDKLRIRTATSASLVGALSGGNQQKVVIGRQLLTRPELLLLDDPTRGVDVGAKAEIYRVLRGLAADGLGVLFASSELPELVDVCDRVVVLRHGQVAADWPAGGLTQEDILAAAQGELE